MVNLLRSRFKAVDEHGAKTIHFPKKSIKKNLVGCIKGQNEFWSIEKKVCLPKKCNPSFVVFILILQVIYHNGQLYKYELSFYA